MSGVDDESGVMGSRKLRLTGRKWCSRARRQKAASMLPLAEVVCPVKPLVLLNGGSWGPKTRWRAVSSLTSLLGVPVP